MSTNTELSRIFSEMAAVLEITGDNVFRVNAHNKVARILKDLTVDVGSLADDKSKLTAIDGIGEGTASRIIEYVQTGRVKDHDELVANLPPGLVQLLNIPGVGPKTVKMLWEKAGVTDLESLRSKLQSGELQGMPKMGDKTLQNINAALEFVSKASERERLGDALPLAENIIEFLRQVKGVKQLEYAGSLRRGKETVGDIDLIASASDPSALTPAFRSMAMIDKVLASGESKTSVRLADGMQIDLRIVPDSSFGAALL